MWTQLPGDEEGPKLDDSQCPSSEFFTRSRTRIIAPPLPYSYIRTERSGKRYHLRNNFFSELHTTCSMGPPVDRKSAGSQRT